MTEDFDPRSALDAVQDTRNRLADRIVTPWWYHPSYGLFIALACLGIGLPDGTVSRTARLYIFLVVIMGNAAVAQVYRRKTGLWIQSAAGPHTRRLMIGFAIGMVTAFVASATNYLWNGPWPAPVGIGLLAIVATSAFGRRYDTVLRAELRAGASP